MTRRKAQEVQYFVKCVAADMTSRGGFVWPQWGPIEPARWTKDMRCGNGLHGWDVFSENTNIDFSVASILGRRAIQWVLFSALKQDVIQLGGKVKVKKAHVHFVGSRAELFAFAKAELNLQVSAEVSSRFEYTCAEGKSTLVPNLMTHTSPGGVYKVEGLETKLLNVEDHCVFSSLLYLSDTTLRIGDNSIVKLRGHITLNAFLPCILGAQSILYCESAKAPQDIPNIRAPHLLLDSRASLIFNSRLTFLRNALIVLGARAKVIDSDGVVTINEGSDPKVYRGLVHDDTISQDEIRIMWKNALESTL